MHQVLDVHLMRQNILKFKIKKKETSIFDRKKWFAWHPCWNTNYIPATNVIVRAFYWLCMVERELKPTVLGDSYEYRYIEIVKKD